MRDENKYKTKEKKKKKIQKCVTLYYDCFMVRTQSIISSCEVSCSNEWNETLVANQIKHNSRYLGQKHNILLNSHPHEK